MITYSVIKSRVSKGLNEIFLNSVKFEDFYSNALNMGDLFMVGGAIRDFALNETPRDFDLILNCNPHTLKDFLHEYEYRNNRFGGYKLQIDNIEIDIWSINSHWAFKKNILECTYENISKGAFFNFDAITLNLVDFWLDADVFIKSYESRTLDINLHQDYVNLNPDPEKNIERAYKLRDTMGFALSDRLIDYCNYWTKYLNLSIDVNK